MPTEAEIQEQNTGTSAGKTDGKVVFDEAQQAKINEIIESRLGRESSKYKAELDSRNAKITQLESDLAAARDAAKHGKGSSKDDANDEVSRLRAEIEEVRRVNSTRESDYKSLQAQIAAEKKAAEDARSEALNTRKNAAIMSAADKVGFIDLDDVVSLTERHVVWNDDHKQFVVLNPAGQPRLNASFEPMSLEEYYREYANTKKHLVRSDVLFGSGSAENSRAGITGDGKFKLEDLFGPKSNAKAANDLALKSPAEYQRLRKLAQDQGILARSRPTPYGR